MAVHDSVAEFGGTAHRRVLGEVALDGGNSRVLNMLRRGEVGFTGAEIDYVDALAAQLISFGNHRHGGRRFDPVDPFREFQGVLGFGCYRHSFFLDRVFRAFSNLSAGSIFSRSLCSTNSGTNPFTGPPSCAISRTRRELRYE